MAAQHYFAQAQAESAVGSATRLRQLLPLPGSAVADPDKVDSVLSRADGWIREAIGKSFDLDNFDALWFGTAPQPMSDMDKRAITTQGEFLLAYSAEYQGSGGQAVAPEVIRRYEAAMEALTAMGDRLMSLGSAKKPSTSRHYSLAHPLTPGNYPTGSARAAFKGFT